MAAEPAPPDEQQASGPRSVAASRISGPVVTGLHNLPRPPASVFVGRADVLSRLERSLSAGASVVVTQAVFGLGGVGKSELALQHAYAHRHRYPLTWWITADEPGKVEAGLARPHPADHPPDHSDTVLYRSNLVALYHAVGRDADATALEFVSRWRSAAG